MKRRSLTALVVAVVVVAALIGASGFTDAIAAQAAIPDMPPNLLAVYKSAARTCPGPDWAVLAGIGKVESVVGGS